MGKEGEACGKTEMWERRDHEIPREKRPEVQARPRVRRDPRVKAGLGCGPEAHGGCEQKNNMIIYLFQNDDAGHNRKEGL